MQAKRNILPLDTADLMLMETAEEDEEEEELDTMVVLVDTALDT